MRLRTPVANSPAVLCAIFFLGCGGTSGNPSGSAGSTGAGGKAGNGGTAGTGGIPADGASGAAGTALPPDGSSGNEGSVTDNQDCYGIGNAATQNPTCLGFVSGTSPYPDPDTFVSKFCAPSHLTSVNSCPAADIVGCCTATAATAAAMPKTQVAGDFACYYSTGLGPASSLVGTFMEVCMGLQGIWTSAEPTSVNTSVVGSHSDSGSDADGQDSGSEADSQDAGLDAQQTGLYGSWVFSVGDGGTSAEGAATYNTDGTYQTIAVEFTSSTSAQEQIEQGTFALSGTTITYTPTESTCPSPRPVGSNSYQVVSGALVVTTPGYSMPSTFHHGSVTLPASTVTGCFGSDGVFHPASLAPVTN
jgi:hypothetical protein